MVLYLKARSLTLFWKTDFLFHKPKKKKKKKGKKYLRKKEQIRNLVLPLNESLASPIKIFAHLSRKLKEAAQ